MRLSLPLRVACAFVFCTAASCVAPAQDKAVVLDQVVAVVNNRAILASDIEDELRLSAVEPLANPADQPDPKIALEQLISRALIQQQIRREDQQAAQVAADDIQTRLAELRKSLPACAQAHCATDAGWENFLAAHHLTEPQVQDYLRRRLEVLAFIETRFRQGIRISQDDIASYYRNTLLPQYTNGAQAPPVEQLAPRIEELLLQQQVNVLFTAWLDNLRKQGDVEIFDPALETPPSPAPPQGGGNQ